MSTYMANKATIERKWYVVDAAGKPLGKTAVIVADLLRGKARLDSAPHAALTAVRYFGASLAGNLVVLYLFGITIQSMVMHVPFTTVAIASMGFVIGDVIKAVVASLAATGLAKLF